MNDVVVISQLGRAPLRVQVVDRLDVGRDCDGLLLADERVSRQHLRLEIVDGELTVTDLGSSNGTFLDGVSVRGPIAVRSQSTVTLGSTSIRIATHDLADVTGTDVPRTESSREVSRAERPIRPPWTLSDAGSPGSFGADAGDVGTPHQKRERRRRLRR